MKSVKGKVENDGFGWSIRPLECPAKAHLEALEIKPWHCVGGVSTKAQGAVIMNRCKHFVEVKNAQDELVCSCRFGEEIKQTNQEGQTR